MRRWLLFVLPIVLLAQPRGPRPWWEGDVARNLNLTEAQTKQIVETRREFRDRMIEARSAVNQAEKGVAAAFNDDPVDEAKANDAINRLASARAEATRTISEMELKFRMILTAEQWQELKQRQRAWPGGRGRRGPPTQSPTQK